MDPVEESRESAHEPGEKSPSIAGQFFREIVIFLAGLFLGFFWIKYLQWTSDAHIIVGLVVIIVCLARYIYLIKHRGK